MYVHMCNPGFMFVFHKNTNIVRLDLLIFSHKVLRVLILLTSGFGQAVLYKCLLLASVCSVSICFGAVIAKFLSRLMVRNGLCQLSNGREYKI